jgi:hypothetical protein
MENLTVTFNEETTTYWLNINGVDAGFLELGTGSKDCRQIGNVEIYKDFAGKGLYRTLLTAILQISEIEQFYSDNRNETSNAIWEHWTGEELDFEEICYVDLNSDGTLDFLAEKSL